jgi:hypothetical protein
MHCLLGGPRSAYYATFCSAQTPQHFTRLQRLPRQLTRFTNLQLIQLCKMLINLAIQQLSPHQSFGAPSLTTSACFGPKSAMTKAPVLSMPRMICASGQTFFCFVLMTFVKLLFRLHALYGALRITSLVTDLFVIYHAKDLKLTDSEAKNEEDNANDGRMKERGEMLKKCSKESALDRECEPLNTNMTTAVHVHDISCAPPFYEETLGEKERKLAQQKQKSAKNLKKSSGHKRSASKDASGTGLLPISPSEFEAVRKSSNHHPISEF